MQILAVDVGTGTQDIFLYDSRLDIENGFKLVMPSPTMIVHHKLREATRRREAVLLTGVTMGAVPASGLQKTICAPVCPFTPPRTRPVHSTMTWKQSRRWVCASSVRMKQRTCLTR